MDFDDTLSNPMTLPNKISPPGFFKLIWLLLIKNTKLIANNKAFWISHLLILIVITSSILGLNYFVKLSVSSASHFIYPTRKVGEMKRCDFDENCKSLGYIIIVS